MCCVCQGDPVNVRRESKVSNVDDGREEKVSNVDYRGKSDSEEEEEEQLVVWGDDVQCDRPVTPFPSRLGIPPDLRVENCSGALLRETESTRQTVEPQPGRLQPSLNLWIRFPLTIGAGLGRLTGRSN